MICSTPDFGRAQDLATEMLLNQSINSLFFDIRTFQFSHKILIDSVQHYAEVANKPVSHFTNDLFAGCCCIKHPRCSLILFDANEANGRRRNWGIAHEIGHIYLGHTQDGEKEEKEAHFFAAQTTMPEIALIEIGRRSGELTTKDIYDHFNASLCAATKRIGTLKRRNCWSSGSLDMELLNKLAPIIEEEFKTITPQKENRPTARIDLGREISWDAVIY